jgi:transposase InsO family protein
MPYTINPYMPRLRRDVAYFARRKGIRLASRHFGIPPGTISKWCQKASIIGYHPIPTKSSRPQSHPKQLPKEIVRMIIHKRLAHKRTSEVVHAELKREGITVSVNSVRRTIDRAGLMKKRSPWKRYHPHQDRPHPEKPGDLVQIDTIHTMQSEKRRMYTFAMIDVYSRWTYVKAYQKMNAATSVAFVKEAQRKAPFNFNMIQSDHGPEFGKWFVERVFKNHRYTRIGKPNDNAHIERFNRTVQEECLDKQDRTPEAFNGALKKYMTYYNNERLHLGINCRAPRELIN